MVADHPWKEGFPARVPAATFPLGKPHRTPLACVGKEEGNPLDWLLALHIYALALGTGFSAANLVNLRLAPVVDDPGRAALARLRLALGRIGDGIVALIWLTGVGLAARYLGTGAEGAAALPPAFHAKMLFVLALTLCHAGSRWLAGQVLRKGRRELMPWIFRCTLGTHISAVAAIALAVASFR